MQSGVLSKHDTTRLHKIIKNVTKVLCENSEGTGRKADAICKEKGGTHGREALVPAIVVFAAATRFNTRRHVAGNHTLTILVQQKIPELNLNIARPNSVHVPKSAKSEGKARKERQGRAWMQRDLTKVKARWERMVIALVVRCED